MLFLGYPPCSTCRRARQWLVARGLSFTERNIKENPPSYEELAAWRSLSGKAPRRFFNTSGLLYRELGVKDRLGQMSDEEQLRALAGNGMLVRRPILVLPERVLVGFSEKEWEETF